MVSVILDCKIEATDINEHVEKLIAIELQKDLEIYHKKLSEKASRIIKNHSRLKIFKQGA